jgi:hypothetical protein
MVCGKTTPRRDGGGGKVVPVGGMRDRVQCGFAVADQSASSPATDIPVPPALAVGQQHVGVEAAVLAGVARAADLIDLEQP